MNNFSDIENERLNTRQSLLDNGTQPYPMEVNPTTSIPEICENFANLGVDERTEITHTVVGRLVAMRKSGKIAFGTLQSGDGSRIQILLSAFVLGGDDVEAGRALIKEWAHLCDLGDFLEITGTIITSKTGELSLEVISWSMASKAITPLPNLHDDLNEAHAVRERYAELVVNSDARTRARNRSKIISSIRRTLDNEEFFEIETPVLQNLHGGATARPFKTHLNAFSQDMSLRIAMELNLKKAVVGGFEKVYEIGKVFRNEGSDSTHSPEFTMLESYEAFGDMHSAAKRTREIFLNAADAINVSSIHSNEHGDIDLTQEWEWKDFYNLLSEALESTVTSTTSVSTLRELAQDKNVEVTKTSSGEIALELFDELVEDTLIHPTFVHSYPAIAQPLARPSDNDPNVVHAWDLYINGVECATGFTELVDPVVQEEVLREQSLMAANGDPEAMELDESFLRALRFGAPPMGGLGIGVDRLVMMLTGSNIREAILFPLLRNG